MNNPELKNTVCSNFLNKSVKLDIMIENFCMIVSSYFTQQKPSKGLEPKDHGIDFDDGNPVYGKLFVLTKIHFAVICEDVSGFPDRM